MIFAYTPVTRAALEQLITRDRLSSYIMAASGDLAAALDLYCWNVALSAAFHGPLGALEIALKNAIHKELTWAFGATWYDDAGFRQIDAQIGRRIEAAKRKVGARGKNATTPRIVAELSFGFWVHLLRAPYVKSLWGPALHRAFPSGTKRATIQGYLEPLLAFRNRIAHHEPIHQKRPADQYRALMSSAALLSSDLAGWIQHHSRVPEIIARGPHPPRWVF